jgi:type IV pilus assembly protein PilV
MWINYCKVKGFTLVELLVATVILAVGLLGLAAMQTVALKDSQDAFFYAQASSLAYEMSDRMKVNPMPWRNATLPAANVCDHECSFEAPCAPDQMAEFDYCAWNQHVQSQIAAASATVAISPVPGSTVCTGDATRRCLTISWGRNQKRGVSNTISFQLEVQP